MQLHQQPYYTDVLLKVLPHQIVYREGEIPTDKMTYRTSPTTGDRVSLFGIRLYALASKAISRR